MGNNCPSTTKLAGCFLFFLLLSPVVGFNSDVRTVPTNKIGHSIAKPLFLQVSPDPVAEEVNNGRKFYTPVRRRGERRRTLLSRVKPVLPKKRKVACFAIAIMFYLRGPSLLTNEFDPNVAHAGINVRVSGVKVEATIKDIPALLPVRVAPRKRSDVPKTVVKSTTDRVSLEEAKRDIKKLAGPVASSVKKVATSDLPKVIASRPGSMLIAAGSGIFAGTYARRTSKEGRKN